MENQKRATDPIWSPTLFTIRKIIVSKNEPVLYYLDGEYAPITWIVREELMHVNPEKIQYQPQRILFSTFSPAFCLPLGDVILLFQHSNRDYYPLCLENRKD